MAEKLEYKLDEEPMRICLKCGSQADLWICREGDRYFGELRCRECGVIETEEFVMTKAR